MNTKTCRRCNVLKPLHEYYKHPGMADGHLHFCKSCKRDDAEKRRQIKMQDPDWAAKEAERQRKKTRKRLAMFPEKTEAHKACSALRAKHKGKDLHHWSYHENHRTDVFPLSRADHLKIHSKMQYDQERAMYRTIPDLRLLDTRQAASEYYSEILQRQIT